MCWRLQQVSEKNGRLSVKAMIWNLSVEKKFVKVELENDLEFENKLQKFKIVD